MKKITVLISILISFFILNSCSNDLDFSNSWIKYSWRENGLDPTSTYIKSDTMYVSLDDKFTLHIRTQSNDGSKPKIYKQIDNNEINEITNRPLKAAITATYFDPGGGYRQINEIHIYFPSHLYNTGQIIKYTTAIGSKTGELKNEIYLILK